MQFMDKIPKCIKNIWTENNKWVERQGSVGRQQFSAVLYEKFRLEV